MNKENNYVITIARGFGTGGKMIARELGEQLGIECYENRILTLASEIMGRNESELIEMDEKLRGSYVKNKLCQIPKTLMPTPVTKSFVADGQLFDVQSSIIENLADTESCIIVGKCADYILSDRDNVLSVYIEAPRSFCVGRVMKRMNMSEREANKKISQTDKFRAEYYKFYTGGNYWTNPVNYDITLNSEKLGLDGCVKAIKACLKIKFGIE